jgi:hypothetical protein
MSIVKGHAYLESEMHCIWYPILNSQAYIISVHLTSLRTESISKVKLSP